MVNPKLTIGFGDNALRKVKSSKTDAIKTFFTVLDSCTDLKQYNTMFEILNQLKIMNPQSEFYMEHKTAVKHKGIPYACIYMSYASDSSLQNSSGSSFIIKATPRSITAYFIPAQPYISVNRFILRSIIIAAEEGRVFHHINLSFFHTLQYVIEIFAKKVKASFHLFSYIFPYTIPGVTNKTAYGLPPRKSHIPVYLKSHFRRFEFAPRLSLTA